jgi:DNA-binding IclR family transcriptional regulator
MRELHRITQQPVNLSMRQGDEIVYIERAYSERSRHAGGARRRRPRAAAPHLGRQALPRRRTTCRACAPMPPARAWSGHTRNSITEPARLERELAARAGQRRARGTTRSWSWACAAWPRASATTRAS